jgi:hypothetical protein
MYAQYHQRGVYAKYVGCDRAHGTRALSNGVNSLIILMYVNVSSKEIPLSLSALLFDYDAVDGSAIELTLYLCLY